MKENGTAKKTIMKRLRVDETGGALVETALTMPMLLVLLLGAVEFANVAYTSLEVTSAAKAGVSYGARTGGTTGDTAGIAYAAANDAANLQTLKVTSTFSSYACSDGTAITGPDYSSQCGNSHLEQTLTVVTQATIQPLIHIAGLPTQYTITSQASQLCLQ